MIVSKYDPQSKSSLAAAEGFHGLAIGNTDLARQSYGKAGDILLNAARAARIAGHKHELLLLAATQFYRGGDYHRASKVLRRIEHRYLSPQDQVILDKFHKDLAPRIAQGYALGIRMSVYKLRQAGRFEEAIDILKEHPYVLDRAGLAYIRADLCLRSGDIEAAVYFSADANRFTNYHPNAVMARAMGVSLLTSTGKLALAEEYGRKILAHEPTSIDHTQVAASAFERFRQGDLMAAIPVIEHTDQAGQVYSDLPEATQVDPEVRDTLSLSYLMAACAADEVRGRAIALGYFELAERYASTALMRNIFQQLRQKDVHAKTWLAPEVAYGIRTMHERRETIERRVYEGQPIAA